MITLSHRCRDNICPPPSSPMVDIELYEQNLRTEKCDPIDTMLKAQTQKINIL